MDRGERSGNGADTGVDEDSENGHSADERKYLSHYCVPELVFLKRAILYAGVRLVNSQFDIFGLTIRAVGQIPAACSALVQDYRATAARGQLVSLVVDRTVCH